MKYRSEVARLLAVFAFASFGACESSTPADISIRFIWEDDPPAPADYGRFFVHASVEERANADAPGRILGTDVQPMASAVNLDLSSISNGDNRVVILEIRDGADRNNSRVHYFGLSEPFSVQPGLSIVIEVRLKIQPVPSIPDDPSNPGLVIDGVVDGRVRVPDVDLLITAPGAVAIVVANDPSFSNAPAIPIDSLTVARASTSTPTYRVPHNLDLGLGCMPCADGPRVVFAKVLNAQGYESATLSARVTLDRTGPKLIAVSISPITARSGINAFLTATLDEQAAFQTQPEEMLRWRADRDPGFVFFEQSGLNYVFRAPITAAVMEGTYTLEALVLQDPLGNTTTSSGSADGFPLVFTVDNVAPTVSNLTLSHERVGSTPGTVIEVRFSLSEPAPDLNVTIGGQPATCPAATGAAPIALTCTSMVMGNEVPLGEEVIVAVIVRAIDGAGNTGSAESSLTFDFLTPQVSDYLFTPQNARDGVIATLTITSDERLAPGSRPALTWDAGNNPGFTYSRRTGLSYTFTSTINMSVADGTYTLTEISVADAAGNVGMRTIDPARGRFIVDRTAPAVTNLAIGTGRAGSSPARAGPSDTVTITFEMTEDVMPLVTIGSIVVSSCTRAGTAPIRYTCLYAMNGTEIPTGTEAFQPVLVRASDAAGNTASASGDIVFDFRAPTATVEVSPLFARDGNTVQVTVTASEPLDAQPVLTWTPDPGFAFVNATGQRYRFEASITPASAQGAYRLQTLTLRDQAGNEQTETLPANGLFTVDSIAPDVQLVSVLPTRIGRTGTATITFTIGEGMLEDSVDVRIGGRIVSDCNFTGTGPVTFMCTRDMVGDEVGAGEDLFQPVVITAADTAGNRASTQGGLIFDFRAPTLTSAEFNLASARAGATVLLTITADEAQAPGVPIALSWSGTDPGFAFRSAAGLSYTYRRVVDAQLGDNTFELIGLRLEDSVGNVSTSTTLASFSTDGNAPIVSNLRVQPSRIGIMGTATVTFTLSEVLDVGRVPVTIGGQFVDECTFEGAPPSVNWTCSRAMQGTEIDLGTQAPKAVIVQATDGAGNTAGAQSSILYDFEAPRIEGLSVAPAAARDGDDVSLTVSVSELLEGEPALVWDQDPGLTFAGRQGLSYRYTLRVTPTTMQGTFRLLSATVRDTVRNVQTTTVSPSEGTLIIDSIAPTVRITSVAPDPIGRTGTATIAFDSSELVAASGLNIALGARAVDDCTSTGTVSPFQYTCTYAMQGDEISVGTQAFQAIVVRLTDSAGNTGTDGSGLVFDFASPGLLSVAISPRQARGGQTVLLTVTPNEQLLIGSQPELTWSAAGDPGFTFLSDDGFSYTYSLLIDANVTDGDYLLESVEVFDNAGNVGSALVPLADGRLTIDRTPPVIEIVQVTPARITSNGTATVVFNIDEDAADVAIALTIGGRAMDGCNYTGSAPNVVGTCTRQMVGDEIPAETEASQSVLLRATDRASNPASTEASIVFDFRAPGFVSADITPRSAGANTTVATTVTVDEALAPGTSPRLRWDRDPGFVFASQTGLSYRFNTTVTATSAQGEYNLQTVELSDTAGNVRTATVVGARLVIDSIVPELTLVSITPARIGRTGTATVVFTVSEELPATSIAIAVGGRPLTSCTRTIGAPVTHTCTYEVQGDEIPLGTESSQAVIVRVTDSAGNTDGADGNLIFDFRAPAVVDVDIAPRAARNGSQVFVAITTDEPLAAGTSPLLTWDRDPGFAPSGQTGLSYRFTATIDPADPQGDYVLSSIVLTDDAGNTRTATVSATDGTFTVDSAAPQVTLTMVAPDPIGPVGTATIAFTVNEVVPTIDVSLGGRALTTCTSANSLDFICSYTMQGNEIATGTEAFQAVVVRASDDAGNTGTDEGGLVFDFSPPSLLDLTISPQAARNGTSVLLTVTPNELLAIGTQPGLTWSMFGDPQFTFLSQSGLSYTFARTVDATVNDGTYQLDAVQLVDQAGNTTTATVSIVAGQLFVDRTAPTVSISSVTPLRANATATVTVEFALDENLLPSNISLTIGGRAMDTCSYTGLAPNVLGTCTRTMQGDEIATDAEATQAVLLRVTDSAGNTASDESTMVFDFRAPGVIGIDISPANATVGTNVLVTVTVDEALAATTQPVLGWDRDPGFVFSGQTGLSYRFVATIDGADPAGAYNLQTVTMGDTAGNTRIANTTASFNIDNTVPVVAIQTVAPARIGRTGTATVTFTINEVAAISATIGGLDLTCTSTGVAPSIAYSCTRDMVGDEIPVGSEASQAIVVRGTDLAGNTGSDQASMVFDFRAPGVVDVDITPLAARNGSTVFVTVTLDEPVVVGTFPTVTWDTNPGFTPLSQTGLSYRFSTTIDENDTQGPYVLTSIALTDDAGNTQTVTRNDTFTVDSVAPDVKLNEVTPDPIGNVGTVTIAFSLDAAAQLDVSVGGRPATSCAAGGTSYRCYYVMRGNEIPAGTEAFQAVVIRATDGAGNTGSAQGGLQFDFRAPTLIGVSLAPVAARGDVTVLLTITPDELLAAGTQPELTWSATGNPGFTFLTRAGLSYTFSRTIDATVANGTYVLTNVRLQDAAGNVAVLPVDPMQGQLTVDRTAPNLTITSVLPERIDETGTATVVFTIDEVVPTENVSVTIGGRAVGQCSYSGMTAPITGTCTYTMVGNEIPADTEATQAVLVRASDVSGNPASAESTMVFDFRAPGLVGVDISPANASANTSVLVTVTVDETLATGTTPTLTWDRDPGLMFAGQTGLSYRFARTITVSDAPGAYTLQSVTIGDEAGNARTTPTSATFNVDTSIPTVSIQSVLPARLGRVGTATVVFTVSEIPPTGGLSATVGGRNLDCTNTSTTPSISYTCTRAMVGDEIPVGTEASQAIVVRATDSAGNTGSDEGSTVFDFRAPAVIDVDITPAAARDGTTVFVAITLDEPVRTGTFPILTWDVNPGFTELSQTGLSYRFSTVIDPQDAQGQYTLQTVGLTDDAGNSQTVASGATFTVDSVAPQVTLTSVAPDPIGSVGTVTIAFGLDDTVPLLDVQLGGRAVTACTSNGTDYTCTYTMQGNEIPDGTEAFQAAIVRATDAAGNTGSAQGGVQFDFRAPGLISVSLTPQSARGGVTVLLTVTPDELLAVGSQPLLTWSPAGDPGFVFLTQTGLSYTFSRTIDGTIANGTYQLTNVTFEDAAQNMATVAVNAMDGELVVDRTAPGLSIVSVMPARIGATGTATVVFDIDEDVPAQNISVTIGGRAVNGCTYDGATPPIRGTCTYAMVGNEITAETEATQAVLVRANDAAGNPSSTESTMVFDFRAPDVVFFEIAPTTARDGTTIIVTINADETQAGGGYPTLIWDRDPGVTELSLVGTTYRWTRVVDAMMAQGAYVLQNVMLTDSVGNTRTVAPTQTVSFTVDSIAPLLTNVVALPTRIGRSGTATVTFTSNEALAGAALSVTIGGRQTQPCTSTGVAPTINYVCLYPMVGDEVAIGSSLFQSAVVQATDSAGNTASAQGGLTFDFRAPALTSSSFSPVQAASLTTVTLTLTLDENTAMGTSPTLNWQGATPPGNFVFSQLSGSNYLYTHTVGATDAEQTYTLASINVVDDYGNAGVEAVGQSFTVDRSAPQVTGLVVTPTIIDETGNVTVTFTVGEILASAAIRVSIGGRVLTACTYVPDGANLDGTCTYTMQGNEIPAGTSETQPVLVNAIDAAGNVGVAEATQVVDFKDPVVESIAINPQDARLGQLVNLAISLDEVMAQGQVPQLTWAAPAGDPGFTFIAANGTNYVFQKLILAGDTDATYQLTRIDIVDAAGNTGNRDPVGVNGRLTIDKGLPMVSNVVVQPAVIDETGTTTVMFDVAEVLAAPNTQVSVTVGGRGMDQCMYQFGGATTSGTCTRVMTGNEIAQGSRVTQTVLVSVTDASGNVGTGEGSTVFDFDDAGVTLVSFTPNPANGSATPVMTVTADEDVDPAFVPTLTWDQNLLGDPVTATYNGRTGRTYSWTLGLGSMVDGTYRLIGVGLRDEAGNQAVAVTSGDLVFNPTVPVLTNGTITPDHANQDDTVTVSFTSNETPAQLSVTIGTVAATSCNTAGTPPTVGISCTFVLNATLVPPGTDVIRPVLSTVTDAAGNVGSIGGAIRLDARAPSVAAGSETRFLVPHVNNPLTRIDSIRRQTTVQLVFAMDENVLQMPAPLVVASRNASTLAFTLVSSSSTSFVYEYELPTGAFEQGSYDVQVTATDLAGNTGPSMLDLTLQPIIVDTVAPAAPTASVMTYRRAPWGTSDSQATPFFQVEGPNSSVVAPITVIVYDGIDESISSELGRTEILTGSAVPTFDLSRSDRERVYAAAVDGAGNASTPTLVENVEWIATYGQKVLGSTIRNPHQVIVSEKMTDTLLSGSEATDPSRLAIGQLTPPFQVNGEESVRYSPRWQTVSLGNVTPDSSGNNDFFLPMVYSRRNGQVLHFTGVAGDAQSAQGDIWIHDGDDWVRQSFVGAPSRRNQSSVAYDEARGRLVVFGGDDGGGLDLNETWEFDGRQWFDRSQPTNMNWPAGRSNAAMTYDASIGRVVMTGGHDTDANVWSWDGTEWTVLAVPGGLPLPDANDTRRLVYDRRLKRLWMIRVQEPMVGGAVMWGLDNGVWMPVPTPFTPNFDAPGTVRANRFDVAYDEHRGEIIAVAHHGDLDAYRFRDGNWADINFPINNTSGSSRIGASLVYDPLRKKVLCYVQSENDVTAFGTLDDGMFFEWDGQTWTEVSPRLRAPRLEFPPTRYDDVREHTIGFSGLWQGYDGFATRTLTSPTNLVQAIQFNPVLGTMLGYSNQGQGGSTTYSFDGTTWSDLSPTFIIPPPPQPVAYGWHTGTRMIISAEGIMASGYDAASNSWNDLMLMSNLPGVGVAPGSQSAELKGTNQLCTVVDVSQVYQVHCFDGAQWTQGPALTTGARPVLAYDSARDRLLNVTSNGPTSVSEYGPGLNSFTTRATLGQAGGAFMSIEYDKARKKLMLFDIQQAEISLDPDDRPAMGVVVDWSRATSTPLDERIDSVTFLARMSGHGFSSTLGEAATQINGAEALVWNTPEGRWQSLGAHSVAAPARADVMATITGPDASKVFDASSFALNFALRPVAGMGNGTTQGELNVDYFEATVRYAVRETPPTTPCGDGLVEPLKGEECDDGNTMMGDGCLDTCLVEFPFSCAGSPSVCALCGDTVVGGPETCDDGNAMDGDGCGSTCQVEPGWRCPGPATACQPDLRIQEVFIGTQDYVVIKNMSTTSIDLNGIQLELRRGGANDPTLTMPTYVLQPGSTVRVSEIAGVWAGDISFGAPIRFDATENGTVTLCYQDADAGTADCSGEQVIDMMRFRHDAGTNLTGFPPGSVFNGSFIGGVTAANEEFFSFHRTTDTGMYPVFQNGDWRVGVATRPFGTGVLEAAQ